MVQEGTTCSYKTGNCQVTIVIESARSFRARVSYGKTTVESGRFNHEVYAALAAKFAERFLTKLIEDGTVLDCSSASETLADKLRAIVDCDF